MRLAKGLIAALLVSSTGVATAQTSSSDNIRLVQNFPMPLGNEIEFDGSRLYVNQYGSGHAMGVYSFQLGRGGLRRTGKLVCSGLTDVAAMGRGMIAIGLQQHGGDGCNSGGAPLLAGARGGVHVATMKDPSRPRLLGHIPLPGGVHTLSRYPGRRYVYTAIGGADTFVAYEGVTHVVDVSDPDDPKVAATYKSRLNPAGCHDILFQHIHGKMIGFCPGLGGTEIWDTSNPLAPEPIGRMLVPFVQLPHQVAVSSDGKVAAVSDEAYVAHGCRGGSPLGALWFYDITDLKEPQLLGFYGPQRGDLPVGSLSGNDLSCTAHNFNFILDSRLMVVAWIAGGTTVIDVSDPKAVKEVAHYRPHEGLAMSSYWYRGRIYVGDFERGLDVLELTL